MCGGGPDWFLCFYQLPALLNVSGERVYYPHSLHTKWVLDFLGLVAEICRDMHYHVIRILSVSPFCFDFS